MIKQSRRELLDKALKNILACPQCKGNLSLEDGYIKCCGCYKRYPLEENIPVFVDRVDSQQQKERELRDSLAYDNVLRGEKEILEEASRYHSLAVMRRQAENFISNFKYNEYILDIGVGFSWHWKNVGSKVPCIVGLDFSMTNLKVARKLLNDNDNVLLICADAASLPIKDNYISGVWSVQAFQHFPDSVFAKVKEELKRVLKERFLIEVVNLNPSSVLKIGSFLSGKKFNSRKPMGVMTLNRLSAYELRQAWMDFVGKADINFGYSELFFHPPYIRFKGYYPMTLENKIALFPYIARHVARQIHLKIVQRTDLRRN